MFHKLSLVCCLFGLTAVSIATGQLLSAVEQVSGHFGQVYRGSVSSSVNYLYVFGFLERANATQAVRVHVASSSARADYPVLFVIRQQRSILSFQVPEILESGYFYNEVARTLCPVERASKGASDKNQTIYIDVSSASRRAIPFYLNVTLVQTFQINIGGNYLETVTPSRPKYFRVTFPAGVRHLSIAVESNDTACMIVSAQAVGCPVYDLVRNVEFTGIYQTMTSKAEITVGRRDFEEDSFYVVFVLKPSRHHCSFTRMKDLQPKAPNYVHVQARSDLANATEVWRPSEESHTSKTFIFSVKQSLESSQYFLPVFGAIAFFAAFHLLTFVILLVHGKLAGSPASDGCCPWLIGASGSSRERLNDPKASLSQSAPLAAPNSDYGSTGGGGVATQQQQQTEQQRQRTKPTADDPDDADTDDFGSGSEAADGSARDFRHQFDQSMDDAKPHQLFVSDLCQKRPLVLRNKYRLYYWYLIIVSIFYGLPVVQLVITYQQILRISGNQDICYYNFYCAHPLGVISAFNNVFSNIGYVILGLLFLGLTRRRDLLDKRRRDAECSSLQEQDSSQQGLYQPCGIPQHFGIFYAMGIALIMEGIMSGCYHVCPSYSNFQFDTAYMYVLAVLCMLKIYQIRHPDINASAHVACMAMAIVIFVSVVGVVYGTVYFWAAFTVFFIFSSLFLTGEVYYMGHWKVNVGLVRRFYLLISSQGLGCFKPMYKDRMVILLTANFINWAVAIYGAIRQPQDFNSFLLYIFMGNLLMYITFYAVMKVRSGERILLLPTVFVVLGCGTWAAGLYFFMQRPSNWANSPAESRSLNQRCMLFGFYDVHDIWHFLSSLSLFFSFMVLLTLDDDLENTPRNQIPVF